MRYAIALVISILIIGGMFALDLSTRYAVEEWASKALDLSSAQILRVQVAFFWARYGVLLSPLIIGLSLLIARATERDTDGESSLRR